jgi:hypothetical protein
MYEYLISATTRADVPWRSFPGSSGMRMGAWRGVIVHPPAVAYVRATKRELPPNSSVEDGGRFKVVGSTEIRLLRDDHDQDAYPPCAWVRSLYCPV